MAYSLVITTNPYSPQPLNVNGNVRIMPNLGAVDLCGTVSGHIDVCEGSSVVHSNPNVPLTTNGIDAINCSSGGGGEG